MESEVEKMKLEIDNLHNEVNLTHQAKQQAEQAVAVANANINASNQRSKDLEDRLNKTESINLKMQEKIDVVSKETVTLNLMVQAGQSKLEAAVKQIEDLKKARIDAEVALAALVVKVEPSKTKGKPGPKPKQAPVPEAPEYNNDNGKDSQTIQLALQA
jgi:chromosome segregation ATPase